MATITNFLSSIDLDSLLTIFDVQIALAVIIIAFLTKGMVSRIVIAIIHKIMKSDKKAKDSEMYGPIKKMFVILAVYIALKIIPKGERMSYIVDEIFKVITIIFVTKSITTLFHSDSRILKKFLKKNENEKVNALVCKVIRGIIWIISIFVIIDELGYANQISGFLTGLGFASAIIALAAQELVKNLLSRSFYSY